jgi:type VI protein secretion system component Hcp
MPIYVKIPGLKGDVQSKGWEGKDYFVADSFSFGVEREMKESGEKAGTEDINIGVGELQECTISKSMDGASAKLAQFAINGNSCGTAEIDFVEVAGDKGEPVCYLKYKLERCFVKSWSTSGDADDRPTEEIAFYYNKIAFAYTATPDGKKWLPQQEMAWDNVRNKKWDGHAVKVPAYEGS